MSEITPLVGIPFSQHFKVHQYATVPAGGVNVRVFYGKIPNSCVGFLYKVGNNYHSGCSLSWKIDGSTVEGDIERTIGEIDHPANYTEENGGPYIVKDYIEFSASNPTANDLIFEVLADGVIYNVR